ncbi:hypothetical protein [Viridibacillus arvi]
MQLGEIFSHVLINQGTSLSNEEIVEASIKDMHEKVVRKGWLNK